MSLKGDESTSSKESSEEIDKKNDEPNTTLGSKVNPERESYNMNDLKALDYNSADEVRQAMKLIISENPPHNEEDSLVFNNNRQSAVASPNHKLENNIIKTETRDSDNSCAVVESIVPQTSRKRRGRPPKAGPSKKSKKREHNLSDLYLGKLSNVMNFHNKRGKYEYDSDTDIYIIY